MYTRILRSNLRDLKFARTFCLARILNFKFADLQMITVSQSRTTLHCQRESE